MGCSNVGDAESTDDKQFQDLRGWKGLTREELQRKLHKCTGDEVRIYTVASTILDKKSHDVRHTGCGPNLEGGLATLCTCKHSMRQSYIPKDWKGRWILGLTSRAMKKGFSGEHYLFYLMKVSQAFESHRDLFEYLAKGNRKALQIKNATKNPFGDVYQPRGTCADALNPSMYDLPCANHSHGSKVNDQWVDDIVYKGKRAPLLLGDIENTFVWPQPVIRFTQHRGVGNLKLTLWEDLFNFLK